MRMTKNKLNLALTAALAMTTVSLTGCNSSNNNTTEVTPVIEQPDTGGSENNQEVATGSFRTGIAPVAGVGYETGSQSGVTDVDGQFAYVDGESVTFSIGGVTLGSVDASQSISPVNFFDESTTESIPVQNMNRLLVMLDDDNNYENGIKVYDAIISQADAFAQVDFNSETFDEDVAEIIAAVAQLDDQSSGLPPMHSPIEYTEVLTVASIDAPWGDGITMTPQGDVLLSGGYDKDNIIKVTPEGEVSTLVTGLPGPVGIDYDSHGNLYVANYSGNSISKVTPDGEVTTFASGLNGPAGLLVTPDDKILVSLYGANFSGVGGTIVQFNLEGNQSVYAQGNGLSDVIGLAQDEQGRVFVTNWQSGDLFKIVNGVAQHIATTGDPVNQITYANGYIYLPTLNHNKVYRAAVYSGSEEGTIETFAGNGDPDSIDGSLNEAAFYRLFNAVASNDGKQIYLLGQDGKLRVVK